MDRFAYRRFLSQGSREQRTRRPRRRRGGRPAATAACMPVYSNPAAREAGIIWRIRSSTPAGMV